MAFFFYVLGHYTGILLPKRSQLSLDFRPTMACSTFKKRYLGGELPRGIFLGPFFSIVQVLVVDYSCQAEAGGRPCRRNKINLYHIRAAH